MCQHSHLKEQLGTSDTAWAGEGPSFGGLVAQAKTQRQPSQACIICVALCPGHEGLRLPSEAEWQAELWETGDRARAAETLQLV